MVGACPFQIWPFVPTATLLAVLLNHFKSEAEDEVCCRNATCLCSVIKKRNGWSLSLSNIAVCSCSYLVTSIIESFQK